MRPLFAESDACHQNSLRHPFSNRLFRFHSLDFYRRNPVPVHRRNREAPTRVLNKLSLMRYVPELRQQKSCHRFKSRVTG